MLCMLVQSLVQTLTVYRFPTHTPPPPAHYGPQSKMKESKRQFRNSCFPFFPASLVHLAPVHMRLPMCPRVFMQPDPDLPTACGERGWYLQCGTLLLKGEGWDRLLAAHRAGHISRGANLAVLGFHRPAISGQVFPLLGDLFLRETSGWQGLSWVSSRSSVVQLRCLDWCGGVWGVPAVHGPCPLHSWPHGPIQS